MSVTSSAYSRSPPTGRPRAIRLTTPTRALEPLGQVHRGRLALERRVRREDDLLDRVAVALRVIGAGEQLPDLETVRPDAVDRRDRAMEDVVEALELGRPLEREDVERLLDHAQLEHVARLVAADRAERRVADVEAALAEHDLVAHGDERRGERPGIRVGGAQEVVGQALGGLGPDARQARERLDQASDGFDQRSRHASTVTCPGCAGHRSRPPSSPRPRGASCRGRR